MKINFRNSNSNLVQPFHRTHCSHALCSSPFHPTRRSIDQIRVLFVELMLATSFSPLPELAALKKSKRGGWCRREASEGTRSGEHAPCRASGRGVAMPRCSAPCPPLSPSPRCPLSCNTAARRNPPPPERRRVQCAPRTARAFPGRPTREHALLVDTHSTLLPATPTS